MKSIQKSLCRSIVGGLFCLSLLFGTVGFLGVRHILLDQVNEALIAKAHALANLIEIENGKIYFEFSDSNMPEFISGSPRHFFQVWLPDGEVLARSASLANQDLPHLQGTIEEPVVSEFDLADNIPARAVGFAVNPILEIGEQRYEAKPTDQKPTIVVARESGDVNALLARLFLVILAAVSGLPLLAAAIVSAAVRRGLRPLNMLSDKVAAVDASSLHTKFAEGDEVAELRPITHRLNDLLSRLGTAFEREKRFTMDASHELRTPLAESRTALEIALKWPEDKELLLTSATQALEATLQMESMVAALLELARAEADQAEAPREPVDIGTLVTNCWKQVRWLAPQKYLEISDGDMRYTVNTNRSLATAIVTNLLSNALQHSPQHGCVRCRVERDSPTETVKVIISNSMASPLSAKDISHLFEPLWRKDKSRTETVQADAHFGLGLTLVKAYCEKLGATVEARTEETDFIIEVRFPMSRELLNAEPAGAQATVGV